MKCELHRLVLLEYGYNYTSPNYTVGRRMLYYSDNSSLTDYMNIVITETCYYHIYIISQYTETRSLEPETILIKELIISE
jgi:hypothetical protein